MARGQRKAIEDKITEEEELVQAVKVRLKAEQGELDALYREKRDRDLEGLNQMIAASGLNLEQAASVLQDYIQAQTTRESA